MQRELTPEWRRSLRARLQRVRNLIDREEAAPDVSLFNSNYLNWKGLKRAWLASRHDVRGIVLDIGGGRGVYRRQGGTPQVRRWIILENEGTHYMTGYGHADLFADGMCLPCKDRSVDTVLCTQVLEHVRDPEAILREAGRVLKPGGRFIVSVPFIYHLHGMPDDYYRFSAYGMEHLLTRSAGFRILALHPVGYVGTCLAELMNGVIDKLCGNRLYWLSMWLIAANNLLGWPLDHLRLTEFIPNYWFVCEKPDKERRVDDGHVSGL